MLEDLIKQLICSIDKLTTTLENSAVIVHSANTKAAAKDPVELPYVTPAPAPAPAPAPVAPAASAVSLDDLRQACLACSRNGKMAVLKTYLASKNARRIQDLTPDQYDDCYGYLKSNGAL